MNGLPLNLDAAEFGTAVFAQTFVVVARDVDDPRSLAHLAQKLLQNVVM